MKYCENCHVAAELPRCPLCGGKKLREIKEDDYCFLTEMRAMNGEMLADILRGNGIECVSMPSGSGLNTAMALPLENSRLCAMAVFGAGKSVSAGGCRRGNGKMAAISVEKCR